MFLHDAEEFDDDLRARSDQDLSLSGLFRVVHAVERIVEDAGLDHVGDRRLRFSDRIRTEVSIDSWLTPHVSLQQLGARRVPGLDGFFGSTLPRRKRVGLVQPSTSRLTAVTSRLLSPAAWKNAATIDVPLE